MKKTSVLLIIFYLTGGSFSASASESPRPENPFKMRQIIFEAVRSGGLSPISYTENQAGQVYSVNTLENVICTVEVDNTNNSIASLTCE